MYMYFSTKEFYAIKFGFESGRVHYWLLKGKGPLLVFEMGSLLLKSHLFTLSPVLMGEKRGGPTN
jgi:hypothetical protein